MGIVMCVRFLCKPKCSKAGSNIHAHIREKRIQGMHIREGTHKKYINIYI